MLFMPCVWTAAERLCRPLVRYLCKMLQKYEHLWFFTNIQHWKCVRFLQKYSTKTRVVPFMEYMNKDIENWYYLKIVILELICNMQMKLKLIYIIR